MGGDYFTAEDKVLQGMAEHHLCGEFGQGYAGCLTDKRDCSTGSRIYLQNKKPIVFDGILYIHQTHNIKFQSHEFCSLDNLIKHGPRNTVRRQHTGRISGMNTRLFNMLHDSANHGFLAV